MSGVTKHVVVGVDDDFRVRESIVRLAESAGYTPLVFPSAEAVLESGALREAACLVSDVRMPGMGGLELEQQLKSLGFKLPIIVMTLKGDMETAVRAMKGGAVDFIEKPFNDEGLLVAINAALALPLGPARDSESMPALRREQPCARERLRDGAKCGSCHRRLFERRPAALNSAARFDKHARHSDVPLLVDFWAAFIASADPIISRRVWPPSPF